MNTNTEVKSVEYKNSKRVATLTQTVSRADDCEELGNLYFRLSDIYRRLDMETDTDIQTALLSDRDAIITQINTFTEYLAGYDTAETE
ncbi:MAG: hypothetical protein ACI4XJ_08915 [Eubacteriales bacterium]